MVQLTIWRAGRGHPSSPYGEWDGDVPARHTSSGMRSRSSYGYLWVICMVEEWWLSFFPFHCLSPKSRLSITFVELFFRFIRSFKHWFSNSFLGRNIFRELSGVDFAATDFDPNKVHYRWWDVKLCHRPLTRLTPLVEHSIVMRPCAVLLLGNGKYKPLSNIIRTLLRRTTASQERGNCGGGGVSPWPCSTKEVP